MLAIFALAAGLVTALYFMKKTADRQNRRMLRLETGNDCPQEPKLFLTMLFHPLDTYSVIRLNRPRLKWRFGLVFLAAAVVSRLVYILIASYSLTDVDVRTANLWLEIGKILLLVLTYCVANFAVTSIMSGETKFSEIFTVTCASLSPYILLTIPLGLLSRVLCGLELPFYRALETLIIVWILLLLFASIQQMNNFSLRKTVLVVLLCLFVMVLIWTVAVLVILLTQQLVEFFTGLYKEWSYKLWF